jgi:hypothetical protein
LEACVAMTEDTGQDWGARNLAILDQLLRDCCLELMADYGLPASLQSPPGQSEAPLEVAIAAIDFSGRDLRGTIGLRMTTNVVLETYRAALGRRIEADSSEAKDWTCELANQLIGRLKNKLRSFSVSFTVNMPRLLASFPVAELERAMRNRFVCDRGAFAGYLDVMITPGFTLTGGAPEGPLVNEGDVVLF